MYFCLVGYWLILYQNVPCYFTGTGEIIWLQQILITWINKENSLWRDCVIILSVCCVWCGLLYLTVTLKHTLDNQLMNCSTCIVASRSCLSLTGPWFNIKKSSYQYRKSHCGDKTVVRSSYLHNEISYTGKMASFYWISPQIYSSGPDVLGPADHYMVLHTSFIIPCQRGQKSSLYDPRISGRK